MRINDLHKINYMYKENSDCRLFRLSRRNFFYPITIKKEKNKIIFKNFFYFNYDLFLLVYNNEPNIYQVYAK